MQLGGGQRIDCANWRVRPRPDQRVRLAVRPEDVRIAETPDGLPNTVSARVDWIEFLGSVYRLTLTLEDDENQSFRTELSANAMRDIDISSGMGLPVVLPRDRLWVYEA